MMLFPSQIHYMKIENYCLNIIYHTVNYMIQYNYYKQKEKVLILNHLECSKKTLRHLMRYG